MLRVSSNSSVPVAAEMRSCTDRSHDDDCGPVVWRLPAWLSLSCCQGRLFWLVVLFGPSWLLDEPLAAMNLYQKKILLLGDIRDATRQFGEPIGVAWISLVLWFLDRFRRRPLVVAIVAALIASGIASGSKLLVGRERPKVSDGKTILNGPQWPGAMKPDPSFPSGHTAIAFAFACGLCRLYPRHRKLWLFLAACCGLSRALGGAHFLTDVIVGSWLGWEAARVFWESRIGGWLMARLDRRIADADWFPRWDWELAGHSRKMSPPIAQGGA